MATWENQPYKNDTFSYLTQLAYISTATRNHLGLLEFCVHSSSIWTIFSIIVRYKLWWVRGSLHFHACCLHCAKPFSLLLLEVEIKYELPRWCIFHLQKWWGFQNVLVCMMHYPRLFWILVKYVKSCIYLCYEWNGCCGTTYTGSMFLCHYCAIILSGL